jgi:hypothetical protein
VRESSRVSRSTRGKLRTPPGASRVPVWPAQCRSGSDAASRGPRLRHARCFQLNPRRGKARESAVRPYTREVDMRKLTLALVAVCVSAAVAGAHAAQGSPADTDKAGRAGPGTAAGQMGAADPTKAGTDSSTSGTRSRAGTSGATSSTGATGSAGTSSSSTGTSSPSSGASAASSTDEPKVRRTRRGGRASKG